MLIPRLQGYRFCVFSFIATERAQVKLFFQLAQIAVINRDLLDLVN